MKEKFVLSRCLALTVLVLLPHAPVAATAFDTDLEGWKATGIDFEAVGLSVTVSLTDNTPDMVWSDTDGNPPGFAKFVDEVLTPSAWAEAPSSFYNGGDLTDFIGGTLSFEHKLISAGQDVASEQPPYGPYVAVFISGDPSTWGQDGWNALVWSAPGPSAETDWVPFSIGLNATDLTLIPDVVASDLDPDLPSVTPRTLGFSSSMTFEEIMANVTTLLLPFELVNNQGAQNSEMGGLDNVTLTPALTGPEPTISSLLLLSIAALRFRR